MKTLQGFCIAFGSSQNPSTDSTKIQQMMVLKFLVAEENLRELTCFKRRSLSTKKQIVKQVNLRISAFAQFLIDLELFRDYVAAIRERDPAKCWPFGTICEFKDLNTQYVATASQLPESSSWISLKVAEDTNAPKLPEVEIFKGKEVAFEAPTAFLEISIGNEIPLETATELTKGNDIDIETETAMGSYLNELLLDTVLALLEISKGNKAQLETGTEFAFEILKEKETPFENATAFELELTEEKDTDYETDTATEIIDFNELEDGMGEIVSDGATELVNLSEPANGENVNGGCINEIGMISDDANSGKTSKRMKKRKFRLLSELLRDLAGPHVQPTVHFPDKVDEPNVKSNVHFHTEISDKSDEDFTIDVEDDSDDDTLGMFLRKRKAVKVASRRSGPRKYYKKKKKPRVTKLLNRRPNRTRTKRTKPHTLEADMALVPKRKKCGPYDSPGGTGRSIVGQPVVEVGGSKDPDPGTGPVVVVDTPGKQFTLVCTCNKNPADFTLMVRGNKYLRRC
ncbi:hypothetical protein L2E82_27643 [Cichorium intybus]|uniref:Uncharacterized protein n=1 Tax=Cichorium intybus TaxID=13427 RepID=A0ACB9CTK3_CICIN|nr:hypothetical protein L2E82_27643 [Cichorium intybus]